jgi:Flp pilus assembly protein TadD
VKQTQQFLFRAVLGVFLLLASAAQTVHADLLAPKGSQDNPAALLDALGDQIDPAYKDRLNAAISAYRIGDLEAFRASYASAINQSPTMPSADVFLGKLLIATNQLGPALNVLESYVLKVQNDAEAHQALAVIALRTNRVSDAWLQTLFAQRLVDRESVPAERIPYLLPGLTELRAEIAERRGQWTESEQLFTKLQELKPDLIFPKWRIGRLKVQAGDLKTGYTLLQEAQTSHPELPLAAMTVAQVLQDTTAWTSDKEAAGRVEKWLQRATTEHPDQARAWSGMFRWLLIHDRAAELIQQYDKLEQSLQQQRDIKLMRCVASRYLDDLTAAETLLQEMHDDNPEDLEVSDQLVQVLIESEDVEKQAQAEKIAMQNLERFQQSSNIVATAAWVKHRRGSKDEANLLFTELANRGQMTAVSGYYLAEFMKSQRPEESKRLLIQAAEAFEIFPQKSKVKAQLRE